jgi:hypothetical protein
VCLFTSQLVNSYCPLIKLLKLLRVTHYRTDGLSLLVVLLAFALILPLLLLASTYQHVGSFDDQSLRRSLAGAAHRRSNSLMFVRENQDSDCAASGASDDSEESAAMARVLRAFRSYRNHSLGANDKKRRDFNRLLLRHKDLVTKEDGYGFSEMGRVLQRMDKVDQRIMQNAIVLGMMANEAENGLDLRREMASTNTVPEADIDKVYELLFSL